MGLKNKRILITAGPTWVPVDGVRVISNIATGETGILLAQELGRLGAKVTLLLGPVKELRLNKGIRALRFSFFDELKDKIIRELKSKEYDIVIHSAAVPDYKLSRPFKRKIKSGVKNLQLRLTPTDKIIDRIKRIDRTLFLVGFKFDPYASKPLLAKKANALIRRSGSDLVVANTLKQNKYSAYIFDNRNRSYGPIYRKKVLAEKLAGLIALRLRSVSMVSIVEPSEGVYAGIKNTG